MSAYSLNKKKHARQHENKKEFKRSMSANRKIKKNFFSAFPPIEKACPREKNSILN